MTSAGRDGRSTIGAVLARLKPDFPDVTISKIRFLEAEGLIAPKRTPSGYRTFSEQDVERLTYVLTAQRDRFWPLKVIREALDAMDRGLQPPEHDLARPRPTVPATPSDPDVPPAAALLAGPSGTGLRLNRAEVARSVGLSEASVDALCTYGLLRPGEDGHFPGSALPIAQAAAALAGFGIEPRHLRAFRTAADRELGLLDQVLSPLRGRHEDRLGPVRGELLHHCVALHVALIKAALAER